MESTLDGRELSPIEARRLQDIRKERLLGFQRLNQLSFMQIISSCPLFIAGVVTLVMALPHTAYPVFNFGPVLVSILVFPMALIGLLATRKATENRNVIDTTTTVKCMYFELCLPNSKANIGLSIVDGIVCLILLLLSVLGIAHFGNHGCKLCFPSEPDVNAEDTSLPVYFHGQSTVMPVNKTPHAK